MNFIDKVIEKAKTDIKTIVLPESEDIRVLEAAEKITKAGFAKIVLIGDINSFIAEDNLRYICKYHLPILQIYSKY